MGDDTTRPCVRCGAVGAATLRLVFEDVLTLARHVDHTTDNGHNRYVWERHAMEMLGPLCRACTAQLAEPYVTVTFPRFRVDVSRTAAEVARLRALALRGRADNAAGVPTHAGAICNRIDAVADAVERAMRGGLLTVSVEEVSE
ncbi:MAG: hypothetical protein VW239_03445 [Candidatus Nanopelagicales bacterium]